MSKIYLKYDTFEKALDGKTYNIYFIQKYKCIYDIISKINILPTVLTNVVYEYTHNEIILKYGIDDDDNDDDDIIHHYYFSNKSYGFDMTVNMTSYNILVGFSTSSSLRVLNDDLPGMERINGAYNFSILNTYMKKNYGISNYFNCQYNNKHIRITCFENVINILDKYKISGIEILNHKQFKYMIVIIKCIINGLRKYYKKLIM